MKILSFIIILFFFASFIGCDKIEEPYLRDGNNGPDTSDCPVPEFPVVSSYSKRVLLEDYTGHKCVNCPAAAVIAHDLREDNDPDLIIVAIHAGFFAKPYPGTHYEMDFRTFDGDELDKFFGIGDVGNPNGMVNRTGYDQGHILGPGNWTSKVEEQLALQPELYLQVINEYSESERKLCTHIKTTFLGDMSEKLNLSVYIIENNIQAPQANNDPLVGAVPDILDYWHMHVLRDAVNGTWGKTIASDDTTSSSGHSIITSYGYTLDEAWNSGQCNVVAFVYRVDNFEIVQAAEAHVVHD